MSEGWSLFLVLTKLCSPLGLIAFSLWRLWISLFLFCFGELTLYLRLGQPLATQLARSQSPMTSRLLWIDLASREIIVCFSSSLFVFALLVCGSGNTVFSVTCCFWVSSFNWIWLKEIEKWRLITVGLVPHLIFEWHSLFLYSASRM